MANFHWNGEPCKVRFLKIKILPMQIENLAWWKPFEGQEREVIEVSSWGQPFLIDNEDGLGYSKITNGGMWQHGSRHFSENVEVIGELDFKNVKAEFSPDKYAEIDNIVNDYWCKNAPDKFKKLQELKKIAQSGFKLTQKPI